jgi:DNA polymerase-1
MFRSYFGHESKHVFADSITSPAHNSIPCNALVAYSMMFARFIRDVDPNYVAVAFDAGKKTFRNDLYPQYKQNRDKV